MNLFKFFIVVFIISILSPVVMGASIVYPKTQKVVINAPTTFFVGNENPKNNLKINSQVVKLSPKGGFYHLVNLEVGDNEFLIDNGHNVKKYVITRNNLETQNKVDEFINYEEPFVVAISGDNIPLRETPYDGGLNRLQHYDKGMPLCVVGEYGDFYKVQLARDDYAWVSKNSVVKIAGYNNSPARIDNFTYAETQNSRIYTIKLNKKVPYTLTEKRIYKDENGKINSTSDGLDLVVYNVKNFPENKYEVHINKVFKDFGFKSYYKNSRELVIEVKNYPQIDKLAPLKGLNITLDAGHGGSELGSVGCLGTNEKDVNLDIVKNIRTLLVERGANVSLTRESDVDLDLQSRVDFAKQNNTDVFISIHNNALPDGTKVEYPTGTSSYFYYLQSADLARKITEALSTDLQLKNEGAKGESFAVVRTTDYLSVLVEVGYMISPEDNEKLLTPEFQEQVAKSIVKGLERYFNEI